MNELNNGSILHSYSIYTSWRKDIWNLRRFFFLSSSSSSYVSNRQVSGKSKISEYSYLENVNSPTVNGIDIQGQWSHTPSSD